jgi:hypothetical protein
MTTTRRTRRAVIVALLGLLLPWIAHAEWITVSPAGMYAEDPTITLTPLSGAPSSLAVQSQTPGDLKWLVVGLPVTAGQAIDAVELCYQAPEAGTFIRQVRLVEALDPAQWLVTHDDPTVLMSPTVACYHSQVRSYIAAAAVSLEVRLEFAQADDVIVINTVSIHVP